MGDQPWRMLSPLLQLPQLLGVPNSLFTGKPSLFNLKWRPGNATSLLVKGSVLSVLETVCRRNLASGTLKTYRHEVWAVSEVGSFTVQAKIHGWIIPSFPLSLSSCLPGCLPSVRFGGKLG